MPEDTRSTAQVRVDKTIAALQASVSVEPEPTAAEKRAERKAEKDDDDEPTTAEKRKAAAEESPTPVGRSSRPRSHAAESPEPVEITVEGSPVDVKVNEK